MPKKPFNCCKVTMMADPAMNPVSVASDKKSMMNPNLSKPSDAWKSPANNVEVKAS